jgi:hypothetical protein
VHRVCQIAITNLACKTARIALVFEVCAHESEASTPRFISADPRVCTSEFPLGGVMRRFVIVALCLAIVILASWLVANAP